jgi:hypothetical protein
MALAGLTKTMTSAMAGTVPLSRSKPWRSAQTGAINRNKSPKPFASPAKMQLYSRGSGAPVVVLHAGASTRRWGPGSTNSGTYRR